MEKTRIFEEVLAIQLMNGHSLEQATRITLKELKEFLGVSYMVTKPTGNLKIEKSLGDNVYTGILHLAPHKQIIQAQVWRRYRLRAWAEYLPLGWLMHITLPEYGRPWRYRIGRRWAERLPTRKDTPDASLVPQVAGRQGQGMGNAQARHCKA